MYIYNIYWTHDSGLSKSCSQRGCLALSLAEGEWDLGELGRRDILQDAHGKRPWAEVAGKVFVWMLFKETRRRHVMIRWMWRNVPVRILCVFSVFVHSLIHLFMIMHVRFEGIYYRIFVWFTWHEDSVASTSPYLWCSMCMYVPFVCICFVFF